MSVAGNTITVVLTANGTSFSRGMDQAQKQLDAFKGKTKDTGRAVRDLSKVTVESGGQQISSIMAVRGALDMLHGGYQYNMRSAERLLSTFPKVAAAARIAFPVIGALALAGMVGQAVNKLNEMYTKLHEMPDSIDKAFRPMISRAREENDTLQASTDKILDQIAALEHKPANHLADALDEARKSADKLGDSLFKDLQFSKQLLKENHIGFLMSAVSGDQSTNNIAGSIQSFEQQLDQLGQRLIIDTHSGASKDTVNQDSKDISDKRQAYLKYLYTNLAIADPKSLTYAPKGMVNMSQFQRSQMIPNNQDQSGVAAILRDELAYQLQTGQTPGLQKAHDTAASHLAQLKADKKVKGSHEPTWLDKRIDMAMRSLTESQKQVAEGIQKWGDLFFTGGVFTQGPRDKEDETVTPDKSVSKWLVNVNQHADIKRNNSQAYNDASLQIAVQTGQVSTLHASQISLATDTERFINQMTALDAAIKAVNDDSGLTPTERNAKVSGLRNQQATLQGQYDVAHLQDQASVDSNTVIGATGDALRQFAQSVTDAGQVISNFAMTTLQSFNDTVIALASGQHGSWRSFGRSVVSNGEGSLLKGAEGLGLKALLGHDPTKKVQHVHVDNMPKGGMGGGVNKNAGGLAGGLLGKLNDSDWASGLFGGKLFGSGSFFGSGGSGGGLSTLLGLGSMLGFADGGEPPVNRPSIVGERGREIFVPRTHGTIIPNHALGGTSQTINIDARQTNPAMVQSAVTRGMTMAYAAAVHKSTQQQQDSSRRRP